MKRALFTAALAILGLSGAAASGETRAAAVPTVPVSEPDLVKPRVLWLPPATIGPATKGTIAVELVIEKGWHIYWPGQNDSGSPLTIDLKLPKGWNAGPVQWPAPMRHKADGDLLDHVLEGRAVLLVDIDVATQDRLEAIGPPLKIGASLNWMVCKDACTVGSAEVEIAASMNVAERKEEAKVVAAARAALPKPLPAVGDVLVTWIKGPPGSEDDFGTLKIRAPRATSIEFYPHADSIPAAEVLKGCATKSDGMTIKLGRPIGEAKGPRPVKGVLKVVRPGNESNPAERDKAPKQAVEYFAIDLPATATPEPGPGRVPEFETPRR